jgi:hypothetical protein
MVPTAIPAGGTLPPAGGTHTVAVCDTREEARETIAAMRAAVRCS